MSEEVKEIETREFSQLPLSGKELFDSVYDELKSVYKCKEFFVVTRIGYYIDKIIYNCIDLTNVLRTFFMYVLGSSTSMFSGFVKSFLSFIPSTSKQQILPTFASIISTGVLDIVTSAIESFF